MKTFEFASVFRPTAWWAAWLWLGPCAPLWGGDIDPVLVGQWPGRDWEPAGAVALSGNHGYAADEEASLQVIAVSNPAKRQRAGFSSPILMRVSIRVGFFAPCRAEVSGSRSEGRLDGVPPRCGVPR